MFLYVIERLTLQGINCVFHYVPLHSSPAGKTYGRAFGDASVTDSVADRLVSLPVWIGLEPQQHRVIEAVVTAFGEGVSYAAVTH
jgi:dTDP-4-amino-4,6-dideoxygalactose transaminase